MSFDTTLWFYQPVSPPTLTGADLAGFVSAFASLGLSGDEEPFRYGIKFGRSIDQDEEPTTLWEPAMPDGLISTLIWPEYDAEASDVASLDLLAESLAELSGTIYRADLGLGRIKADLFKQIRRERSEENDQDLSLEDWSLTAGPILSHSLGSEHTFMVGWIAVGLYGNGYLFPWSFRDLIDRAESIAPIRDLMDLCRRTWPVPRVAPDPETIEARRTMGELWPYPRLDGPWDWAWGIGESG